MRVLFLLSILFCFLDAGEVCATSLKKEPSYSEVLLVFLKTHHLDQESWTSWEKKLKRKAWHPIFYAGVDHALRSTYDESVSDNVSVTSGGIVVGPVEQDFDFTDYRGTTLRFKAVWNLDELLFPKEFLSFEKASRDRLKDKLKFTQYLSKIYHKRQKLMRQYLGSRSTKILHEIYSLTAILNDLTQNHFKGRWKWEVL